MAREPDAGVRTSRVCRSRVADELERLGLRGHAAGDQGADFVRPAGGDHGFDARVDARVERVAGRLQSDFANFESGEGAAAAAMYLADRFSGQAADFDGANNFLRVARGDARGGFPVHAREQAVQVQRAVLLRFFSEPLAQFFGAFGSIGQAVEQRAKIEAGARGDDRELAAPAHVVESFERAPAIFARGENFVGIDQIN